MESKDHHCLKIGKGMGVVSIMCHISFTFIETQFSLAHIELTHLASIKCYMFSKHFHIAEHQS